ncbi:MAG: DUF167 domain-containing protein [Chloroflexi bacterium]|nr:DUF167 domain-containing protein [Chloroflexota bacterium]
MTRDYKLEIKEAYSGAAFTVRVVTRASRVEIAGIQEDGTLKIRLTETHSEGAADRQLVGFLAEKLEVEPDKIEIVAGENARDKLITVDGIKPQDVETKLVPDAS